MIILIEGPRGSGKTHLLKELKKRVNDNDVMFYKYGFVKHMKTLNMEDQENGPGLHYFTISNTLTILELHKAILADKTIIFDRGVFSAYAWSIFRKRLDSNRLNIELSRLLRDELYYNCHVVYVTTARPELRTDKDLFDKYENYKIEDISFNKLFKLNEKSICNVKKRTSLTRFKNDMDKLSESLFFQTLINIIETRKI